MSGLVRREEWLALRDALLRDIEFLKQRAAELRQETERPRPRTPFYADLHVRRKDRR